MNIKSIVLDLCSYDDEQEWFEFKENWFQPEALGEYVSAMSNAAAFHYRKNAYFIWGVNNDTHEIVGTTFNQYCERIKGDRSSGRNLHQESRIKKLQRRIQYSCPAFVG